MITKHIVFLCTTLSIPCISMADAYLSSLTNDSIKQVSITYRVYNVLSLTPPEATKPQYLVRHDWRKSDGTLFLEEFQRPSQKSEDDFGKAQSSISYPYGRVGFITDEPKHGIDYIEAQINRFISSDWVPPLPQDGADKLTRSYPMQGCLIEGNPFMKKYDGVYHVENMGNISFKGEDCIKFEFELDAPLTTWLTQDKALTALESDSLYCLKQEWNVKGVIILQRRMGIIIARTQRCKIKIVQMGRTSQNDDWRMLRVNEDGVRDKVWLIDSITTNYH